jgi:hypothetical protein
MLTIKEANSLTGRVLCRASDGLSYTVTSVSTLGSVHVYDPRKNEYVFFDSLETFNNWAYGTPVSSRAQEESHE